MLERLVESGFWISMERKSLGLGRGKKEGSVKQKDIFLVTNKNIGIFQKALNKHTFSILGISYKKVRFLAQLKI